DGANRAHAVGASGFPHVVVQIVPYTDPPVRLTTWCHALGDTSRDHFENALHSVPGLECRRAPLLHASALLARRETLAYVAFADGTADTLHGGGGLRVDVPLDRLADSTTGLVEKNRWLEEWLLTKLRERHVRFYEEPTVLFDE